jgi:tRNA (guanine-N7-)-methyltransferase
MGRMEHEFGVPIPGRILPPEQWAKTALKKLPAAGPLDMAALFGREAPLVIEIGCGNGRFTLASALARPAFNHLAVDILPVVIRYATRRANQRGLSNTRWAVIGGRELLRDYIAPGSAAEIHCYHPQPYYERRDIHKRLITPEFLALVHRALVPAGMFVVQTDNPAYARYMQTVLPAFFLMEEHPARWPDAPRGRTRREIIAIREKLPIFRAICTRRDELSETDVQRLLVELPQPMFDADRRLQKFDRLEEQGDERHGARSRKRRRTN